MYEEVTEGKTVEDWMKSVFDDIGLQEFISWEEFKEKGYYVFPIAPDWEKDPAGLIKFYEDPKQIPYPRHQVSWSSIPRD